MYVISSTVTIPVAVPSLPTGLWIFRCMICQSLTSRKNRWTLAGVAICPSCAVDYNETAARQENEYRTHVAEENERAERRARREAINLMEGHCEVSYPDGDDSEGARWLYGLHNAVMEAWDGGRFGPDSGEDEDDVLSELAQSAIEVYTHARWQIFVDLCFYSEDVELSGGVDNIEDLTDAITAAFSEIAYRGMHAWLEEKKEDSKCTECGEFPCECCEECGQWVCECPGVDE